MAQRRVVLARLAARRARWQRRRGRRLAVVAMVVLMLPVAAYVATAATFSALERAYGSPPDPRTMQADSMVYDRNGRLIAELHPPGETRIPVSLSQIARVLQQATIAVEDRNFWNEGAVDQARLVSAAFQDLVHGRQQGASTITEQLAKVEYLNSQRSLDRKLHEFFVARHLSTTQTKQQVLEEYLNAIPYGHGATGIEAAARVYFGIGAAQLDLAQASMLAGLPNAPALLDPVYHPKASRARQLVVLDAMVATGAITRAQATQAELAPLAFADGNADNLDRFPAFVQRVAAAVGSATGLDPQRAGLQITTTLDSTLQQAAQDAITGQLSKLGALHVTDGALVAIEPSSGDIVAYVGNAGSSYPASQIDMAATRNARQPGSTMKLFTYSSAIADHKVTMATPVTDAPYSLPKGDGLDGRSVYQVHNYGNVYHGTVPIKLALMNSLNVPAVKVEQMVGMPRVVQQARLLGVTTLDKDPGSYGASLTLGTYPIPLWEMAQAATVFASDGMLHPASELISVKDADGDELLHSHAQARRVMDAGTAFIMNTMLRTDQYRALAFGLRSDLTVDKHLVAAKTGTTQDFRDNLTVGWTPHLAIATWVGNADYTPMRGTTGITGAAPIWHQVMTGALGNGADDWSSTPSTVYQVGEDFFLRGTDRHTAGAATDVRRQGLCRMWTFNGGHYHWCGPATSRLPGDPGAVETIPGPGVYGPFLPGIPGAAGAGPTPDPYGSVAG